MEVGIVQLSTVTKLGTLNAEFLITWTQHEKVANKLLANCPRETLEKWACQFPFDKTLFDKALKHRTMPSMRNYREHPFKCLSLEALALYVAVAFRKDSVEHAMSRMLEELLVMKTKELELVRAIRDVKTFLEEPGEPIETNLHHVSSAAQRQ